MRHWESFRPDDLPLLRQAAADLEAERDLIGKQHTEEIIATLEAEGYRSAAPPGDEPLDFFDPEDALGEFWIELAPLTRQLLTQGAEARDKLGGLPQNAMGVAIYIAVAFEKEVRVRAESEYIKNVGTGTTPARPTLREIFLYLANRHLLSWRVGNMVDLRNRVVHPPLHWGGSLFNGRYYNRMIDQGGLKAPTERGAFRELSVLKL